MRAPTQCQLCEEYATEIWLGSASTSPLQPRSLPPCDFHIFGDLKRDIRGHRFASDEDVCGWVKMWFRGQPTSFFKDGIDRLISQWNKCINSFGDYFWGKKCYIICFGFWPFSFDCPSYLHKKEGRPKYEYRRSKLVRFYYSVMVNL
jgi:hypothetical protein